MAVTNFVGPKSPEYMRVSMLNSKRKGMHVEYEINDRCNYGRALAVGMSVTMGGWQRRWGVRTAISKNITDSERTAFFTSFNPLKR